MGVEMAKASVTVTCNECGREFKVEKQCYNRREADSYEAWVSNQSEHHCPECYGKMMTAKRQAEREAENAAAAEASVDFPALEGTEKQVTWAVTIRAKALANCKARFRVAIARQRNAAKWWIENRFKAVNAAEVAALMMAEDYGISYESARKDANLGKEWAAKILG